MSYIKLQDRVRFFPSLTQKELPLNFDKKFIATIVFDGLSSVENDILYVPRSYDDWSGTYAWGNYNGIVGRRDSEGAGNGLISGLDFALWEVGATATNFQTFNGDYSLFYDTHLNENDQHSGYIYYDIYNLIPSPITSTGTTGNSRYYVSVDLYESQIAPNDATSYEDIG
jgi:hypothetical protein